MIDPTELRIGNFVKSGDGVYKIFAMSAAEVLAIQDISATLESQEKVYAAHLTILKPIPLTPEWLERFGFEKGADGKWYGNGTNLEFRQGGYFTMATAYSFKPNYFPKHVHQLQNLFWCLTGQELKTTE